MVPTLLALLAATGLTPERPEWRDGSLRVLPDAASTLTFRDGWAELPGGGACQLAAPARYADLTDAFFGEEAVLHLACAAPGAARFDLVVVQGRTSRGWRPIGTHHTPISSAPRAAAVPRHPTDGARGGLVVLLESGPASEWVWTELRLDEHARRLVPVEREALDREALQLRIFGAAAPEARPRLVDWSLARAESLAQLVAP